MKVVVHLHPFEDRHIVCGRYRQQPGCFVGDEHHCWRHRGRAMSTQTGPPGTPHPRRSLRLRQAGEVFTGPEVVLHEMDRAFHPWFVGRCAHPGGVGDEPGMLGVVQPPATELRLQFMCLGDNSFLLSQISTANTLPKNSHAASHPAMTAASVCEYVNHTNVCREYTAVQHQCVHLAALAGLASVSIPR